MKKSIIYASILAMSILVAGCGKGGDKADNKESSSVKHQMGKLLQRPQRLRVK